MASELQRRKISGVFAAMDADGDGLLEESDFQALTDRWTAIRGAEQGSEAHARLTSVMMGWWATLLAVSDPARDGDKVTLEDVLAVVDRLGSMTEVVTGTAHTMFDAVDENGDDEISPAEYRQMIEGWTGTATDTDEIFALLDSNGDGRLSRAEFAVLWTEFWAGDSPDAPGNLIFGHYD